VKKTGLSVRKTGNLPVLHPFSLIVPHSGANLFFQLLPFRTQQIPAQVSARAVRCSVRAAAKFCRKYFLQIFFILRVTGSCISGGCGV